ncbi:hypothetical protein O181_067020 [Austropuccinia psidii MF-1]|uniref:Uncharacterized protein n=1 Tax=Austropuccinia psidii MF-1 TaxID=1389203 RepID=A0A9Q3I5N6_9BASI|nr:hypothetical protein [Austropuccinia psidii MF-1]
MTILGKKLFKTPILVTVQPSFWEGFQARNLQRLLLTAQASSRKGKELVTVQGRSSTLLESHGVKNKSQMLEMHALIELIYSTLASTYKELNLEMVIGRMCVIRRVLHTFVDDSGLL